MDEVVRSAMAKWPNVPAVHGWLALDRRGQWLIKGERIENPAIVAFIQRNYEADSDGCWFFQNGPQRVFVDLDYTPYSVRLNDQAALITHTERLVHTLNSAWVDEQGVLILATEFGPATVDDRDVEALSAYMIDASGTVPDEDAMIAALEALQRGESPELSLRYSRNVVRLQTIRSAEVAARFRFNPHPQAKPGGKLGRDR